MPISLNINVNKLDKKRFIKGDRTGDWYVNITLWETERGSESADYGDYIVKQTGEEGDRMPILGNGKYFKPRQRNDRRGGGGYRGRSGGGRRGAYRGRRDYAEGDDREPVDHRDTRGEGQPSRREDDDEIPF